MKEELIISLKKIDGLNFQIEMLVVEIQRMQKEMSKSKKKELEFQPNVSTLTSKLHGSSNRIAAAKESRARSMSVQAGLNQAIQLVVEGGETKTEVQILAEYNKAGTENEDTASNKNSAFIDVDSNEFCTSITISMKEYEFLIQKLELVDDTKSEPTDEHEVIKLKKELEDKKAETSKLKCRLEEIVRRAGVAEIAKLAVESQLREVEGAAAAEKSCFRCCKRVLCYKK